MKPLWDKSVIKKRKARLIKDQKERIKHLHQFLDRPSGCGMVKNEGEPGGGPFWVKMNGSSRLMIVESAQINLKDKEQKKVFDHSTLISIRSIWYAV